MSRNSGAMLPAELKILIKTVYPKVYRIIMEMCATLAALNFLHINQITVATEKD